MALRDEHRGGALPRAVRRVPAQRVETGDRGSTGPPLDAVSTGAVSAQVETLRESCQECLAASGIDVERVMQTGTRLVFDAGKGSGGGGTRTRPARTVRGGPRGDRRLVSLETAARPTGCVDTRQLVFLFRIVVTRSIMIATEVLFGTDTI